jgi:CubicO group peptidase (beta-lactamase class C family)
MNRLLITALLILLWQTSSPAIAQTAPAALPSTATQPPDAAALETLIATARQQWQVPGLAVAIVKDGRVVVSKGFGLRELGRPEAVDQQTLFAIASNTKAFTAAAGTAAFAMAAVDGALGVCRTSP